MSGRTPRADPAVATRYDPLLADVLRRRRSMFASLETALTTRDRTPDPLRRAEMHECATRLARWLKGD